MKVLGRLSENVQIRLRGWRKSPSEDCRLWSRVLEGFGDSRHTANARLWLYMAANTGLLADQVSLPGRICPQGCACHVEFTLVIFNRVSRLDIPTDYLVWPLH